MTNANTLASPALAVRLFLAFAFAYFFSAMLRAVTATLAPVFSTELQLGAADLGLLAGAYFVGFSALQLPLGRALDKHGPRRVLLVLMSVAVLGCVCFAMASTLAQLIMARVLIGAGLAAGLMAPLTSFRHRYSTTAQLRANSWMLMTGSLGMVASTLPVQWLLPLLGWRGLFWATAMALGVALVLIAWVVPDDKPAPAANPVATGGDATASGRYADIVRHPRFIALAPLGFFVYGGMIGVQALWAGPWLTKVAGYNAQQAAGGLFVINLCMLFAFMSWGVSLPRLVRSGFGSLRLMRLGVPLNFAVLAFNLWLGPQAQAGHWALWCVLCTFVSLSQPAVGQAYPAALAGRGLSAYNLVIFSGVFAVQWGMGLVIDALVAQGMPQVQAFRCAFGLLGLCGVLSYLWFLRATRGAGE